MEKFYVGYNKKIHSLVGRKFGHLTVLKLFPHRSKTSRHTRWVCKCVCGTEKVVDYSNLVFNTTRSCGCLKKNKWRNLIGFRSGRLIVKELNGISKWNELLWECQCDCGKKTILSGSSIRNKKVQSCGCLRNERASELNKLPIEERGLNSSYERVKRTALKRNLVFELSKEEFKKLIYQVCYYCGSKPSNTIKNKRGEIFFYSGIDRKNNLLGYTSFNSVSCCKSCNSMKSTMNEKEFIDKCKKIIERRNNGKNNF